MLEIINKYKSRHKSKEIDDLVVGIPKDRIAKYMGMPDNIEFIRSSLDSYEIWVYIKLKKKLFFRKTFNSITHQKFKNFEIIIIYDDEDKTDLDHIKSIINLMHLS